MFFVDHVFPKGSSPGIITKRAITSILLVFLTYNSAGWSLFHWYPLTGIENAWIVLLWTLIFIAWIAATIITFKGLGKWGILIILILFAAFVYVAIQEGWISRENPSSFVWFGQILLVVLFTVGKSFGYLWRMATGQQVTDEAEDVGG